MTEAKSQKRKRTYSSSERDNDNDDEAAESMVTQIEVPANSEVPPHSVNVRFKLKMLEVSVHLIRIPDKCINLNPSETEFYLDTFKYTKKFYLRFKYPQGIKVDVEKADAQLMYGILTVTFPVTEIMDKATGKKLRRKKKQRINPIETSDKPLQESEQSKSEDEAASSSSPNKSTSANSVTEMRVENSSSKSEKKSKKRNRKRATNSDDTSGSTAASDNSEEITDKAIRTTKVEKAKKNVKSQSYDEITPTLGNSKNKAKKNAKFDNQQKSEKLHQYAGKVASKSTRKSARISSEESQQESLAGSTESVEEDIPHKRKKQPPSTEAMKSMIELINKEEDTNREEKIVKEQQKREFFEKKAQEKEKKKKKNEELSRRMLSKVKTSTQVTQEPGQQKLEKPKISKTVSFSATAQVKHVKLGAPQNQLKNKRIRGPTKA